MTLEVTGSTKGCATAPIGLLRRLDVTVSMDGNLDGESALSGECVLSGVVVSTGYVSSLKVMLKLIVERERCCNTVRPIAYSATGMCVEAGGAPALA